MAEVEVGEEGAQEAAPETNSAEEKARSEGWVSLEEWTEKGNDPADHFDADTFNARGNLFDKINEQRDELKEIKRSMRRVSEMFGEEKKRSFEAGMREAEKKHADAVTDGDVPAAQAALQEMRDLENQAAPQGGQDDFQSWVSDNDWFTTDPDLFSYARQMDEFLATRKGGVDNIRTHMDEVKALVESKFPEKFGNPARQAAPVTEQNSENRTRRSTGSAKKNYNNLSATQKQFCDEFVAQGVMTREQYVQTLVDSGEL